MKIYVPKSLLRGFILGILLSVVAVAAAWAGFTGPNRSSSREVRDPGGDEWYCDRSGSSRCWFGTGNPCSDEGGSHPSTSQQIRVCGWVAEDCGCSASTTTETVTLPPATIDGSTSCGSPGDNGWCRSGAALQLSASEPLSGQVIEIIEGSPGGTLCDPADSSSVSCSYSVGGEGNFTIEYWAVSSYGDTSNKGSASLKVDNTPPSINLGLVGGTIGGGGWYRGGSIDVTVSGSDAVSGVASAESSVDGGTWLSSTQVEGDGIHSISARVIDRAGNQSTDSAEVRIDGAPPGLSHELSGTMGRNGWYTSQVSISASGSDQLSGVAIVEMSEGSGPWQSAPITISADGTHNVTIRAEDVAGNGSSETVGIRIDSTPPSLNPELSGTKGNDDWYVSSVVISASASDQLSGLTNVEMRRGSGSWQSSPITISTDGTHNISIRAEDVAGNESSESVGIRIDRTPPSLSPELSGTKGIDGWYISPVSVFASASDSLSGVADVQVSDDSEGWKSGPIVIGVDGTHKPRFRAEDVAGNVTTADGPTIKIDTHPPESAFINPPEGSETWVSGEIPLIGQSSDITSGLRGVEISYDEGATWEALERTEGDWRSTWDSTDLPNGTYVILARASDVAGNIENTARITLKVDNVPPLVDIPEEWPVDQAGTLVVKEGGIGLGGAEVVISSQENTLQSHQYSPDAIPEAVSWDGQLPGGTLAAPGEYSVMVSAWDLVGNRGMDVGRIIVPEVKGEPAAAEPAAAAPAQSEGSSPAPAASKPATSNLEAQTTLMRSNPWIWPAIAWIGLLSSIGFAKLSDPRIKAIGDLRDDITMIRDTLRE